MIFVYKFCSKKFFAPVNIQRATLEMLAVPLCPVLFSSLTQILMLQTLVNFVSIRFHETSFRGYQVVTDGTITHGEGKTDHFCNFSVAYVLQTGSKHSVFVTNTAVSASEPIKSCLNTLYG